MVEFAFVVIPFLFALLGALTAGLNAFEREVAEAAASTGVQLAATTAMPSDPTQDDLSAGIGPTLQLLAPAMLGTTVAAMPPGETCPALSAIPAATVDVCVWLDPGVRNAEGRPALVAETIRGHPATLIPGFGQLLPNTLDLTLECYGVTYQP
jgi:hypothetical protein